VILRDSRGRRLLVTILGSCTQVQVARRVGSSRQTIQRLAAGSMRLSDLALALRFRDAFGVPVDSWFQRVECPDLGTEAA